MPPKKRSKEAIRQAKLEAWEEGRRLERLQMEHNEGQARNELEVTEELEWRGIMLQRLEEYKDPAAGLSVPIMNYREAERRWSELIREKDEALQEARDNLSQTTKAKLVLEEVIQEIRTDQRQERDGILRKMKDLQDMLLTRLDTIAAKTVADIKEEREKAKELFNEDVEKARKGFLILLHELRSRVTKLTEMLKESKAFHSNLPSRIRLCLEKMEKEDLMLTIDTLSFEPENLQYFMLKFPPDPDRPYEISEAVPADQMAK